MYVHLGGDTVVRIEDILGIFELDNTSSSHITRAFLRQQEKDGNLINISDDLPKSFVLCSSGKGRNKTYFSQLNSATLVKRAENITYES